MLGKKVVWFANIQGNMDVRFDGFGIVSARFEVKFHIHTIPKTRGTPGKIIFKVKFGINKKACFLIIQVKLHPRNLSVSYIMA